MKSRTGLRVFLLVFLPFAVFAVLQAIYFSTAQRRALNKAMVEKAKAVAELAAHNIAPGIDFEDRTVIDEIFAGIAKDKDFLYVAVFDASGAVYAARNPTSMVLDKVPRPDGATTLSQRQDHLQVDAPIALADASEWILVVGFSTHEIVQQARQNRLIAGAIGLVTLLLGIVAASWLARAMRQIQKLAQDAQQASRSKSLFLANMSHEIRTPMNGIMGMNQILLRSELSPPQRQWAETIARSTSSLMEIINDILDFSKIESGMLELEQADFSLEQSIHELIESVTPIAEQKGLRLISHTSPAIPSQVRGDPLRVRQVLMNLVGNALKFTSEGHVIVRAIPTATEDEMTTIKFEVQDTGIGIAREAQSKLFRPFLQADATTTRQYGGTGLGLAISHRLVQAMKGTIEVDSAPGEGSRFSVTIPFAPADAPSDEPVAGLTVQGLRALVACNEEDDAHILGEILFEWGIEVVSGIDDQTRGSLDFVVLDLQHQKDEGLALARAIRGSGERGEVPIIALTALDHGADDRSADIDRYLSKPVRRSVLLETIQELMAPPREVASSAGEPMTAADPTPDEALEILIAEDNQVNQTVLSATLRLLGYRAQVVENGRLAVELLRSSDRFAAVLMDCQMPIMDGYTATAAIRGEEQVTGRRRATIIAVTAHAMKGDRDKAIRAGMDDYVTKPVEIEELRQILEKWLSRAPSGNTAKPATRNSRPAQRQSGAGVLDAHIVADLRSLQGPDDPGFLRDVVDQYIGDSASKLKEMRRAVSRGEAAALATAAHALKGASRGVGAFEFAIHCERLQQMGQEMDLEGASRVLATLDKELQRVHEALRRELESQPSAHIN